MSQSQTDRILAELRANRGKSVSLWRLFEVSGSMHVASRISSLNKAGYEIRNMIVPHLDGTKIVKHSLYVLVSEPADAPGDGGGESPNNLLTPSLRLL